MYQDHINKNLTHQQKIFFENMTQYLDTPLYFYGSILRTDYDKKSDIDLCIFSDNILSMQNKLQHFLSIDKRKFKKIIWKKSKKIIYGTKIMYKNPKKNIISEISIFNFKDREDILDDHYSKVSIPFYAVAMLYILKFLHYKIEIMNRSYYAYFKKLLLSYGIGKTFDPFIIL